MSKTIEGFKLNVPGSEIIANFKESVNNLRAKAEETRAQDVRLKEAEKIAGPEAHVHGTGYAAGRFNYNPGGTVSVAESLEASARNVEWMIRFVDPDAVYILGHRDFMTIAGVASPELASVMCGSIGRL